MQLGKFRLRGGGKGNFPENYIFAMFGRGLPGFLPHNYDVAARRASQPCNFVEGDGITLITFFVLLKVKSDTVRFEPFTSKMNFASFTPALSTLNFLKFYQKTDT